MLSVKQFLDTVRVIAPPVLAATASGFEARMKTRIGFGYFFTRDQIMAKAPVDLADVFNAIPTMRVTQSETGPVIIMRGNYGSDTQDTDQSGRKIECPPNIYVDGMLGDMLSLAWAGRPEDIVGMEVYTKASHVPAEFHTSNGCGVVVIWTSHALAPPKPRKVK
jgi:hypothetical protein